MGCDIHLHTEIKLKNRHWVHYSQPKIKRCYPLFALMANVRNYYKTTPISYPKGLPFALSESTNFCFNQDNYNYDVTDTSYLNLEEINLLFLQMEQSINIIYEPHQLFGHLFGSCWTDIDSHLKNGIDDIRFIFWFDNA